MFEIAMAGNFYRTRDVKELLKASKTEEVDIAHQWIIRATERLTVSDRLLPLGSPVGLS